MAWLLLPQIILKSISETQSHKRLASCMSAWSKLKSSERRELQLRKVLLHKADCRQASVPGIFLDTGWGSAQPILVGAIPGLVVLSYIGNWANNLLKANQLAVFSHGLCISSYLQVPSLLEFLP